MWKLKVGVRGLMRGLKETAQAQDRDWGRGKLGVGLCVLCKGGNGARERVEWGEGAVCELKSLRVRQLLVTWGVGAVSARALGSR